MSTQQIKETDQIPLSIYMDFLKERIYTRYLYEENFYRKAIQLVRPRPGFCLSLDNDEPSSRDNCVLCLHLVRDPVVCSSCELRYCSKCAYFLITLFKLNNRIDSSTTNSINLNGEKFNCLTITCPEDCYLFNDNKSDLFKFNVKCININCDVVGDYDFLCDHIRNCYKRTDKIRFKISTGSSICQSNDTTTSSNYDIMRIEESLKHQYINLENLHQQYIDKLSCYNKYLSENHLEKKRSPSPHPNEPSNKSTKSSSSSSSTQTNNLKDKPLLRTRNWNEYSSYFTCPPKLRPNLVQEDSFTLRIPENWILSQSANNEKKLITSSESPIIEDDPGDNINLNLVTSEANEIQEWEEDLHWNDPPPRSPELSTSSTSGSSSFSSLSSEFSPPSINYQPLTQGPTPKACYRSNFKNINTFREFIKRQNNPAKYNLKVQVQKERKNKERLQKRHNDVTLEMAPPRSHLKQISEGLVKAKNSGLSICSIDMENTKIKMRDGTIKDVPIWIAIIDAQNVRVVYHEFIRHPAASLLDQEFGTQIHGLTKEEVNRGKQFTKVRSEVIDLLRKYDRIVVSGQTGDFVNLFISIHDHLQLLPRIVCVSSYYNCRGQNQALGLKFAAFLMFNVTLQQKQHSPLIDSAYSLYLYLIDFERVEKIKANLFETRNMNKGFRGYIYPLNHHMASLLHKTMDVIGDWPHHFKFSAYDNPFKRKQKINRQLYNELAFVAPTPDHLVPNPYKFDEVRKRSLITLKPRRTR